MVIIMLPRSRCASLARCPWPPNVRASIPSPYTLPGFAQSIKETDEPAGMTPNRQAFGEPEEARSTVIPEINSRASTLS